jgi:hypothetical protein
MSLKRRAIKDFPLVYLLKGANSWIKISVFPHHIQIISSLLIHISSVPSFVLITQPSSCQAYCTHEAEWTPFQTHYSLENLVAPGIEPGSLDVQPRSMATRPQRRSFLSK